MVGVPDVALELRVAQQMNVVVVDPAVAAHFETQMHFPFNVFGSAGQPLANGLKVFDDYVESETAGKTTSNWHAAVCRRRAPAGRET